MKFYGRKSSLFGFAYHDPDKCRKSGAYDAMVRAGRKRERQAAKKECQEGIDEYEDSILAFWQDDEWYAEFHYDSDAWDDDFGDEDEDNYQEDFGWYDECY